MPAYPAADLQSLNSLRLPGTAAQFLRLTAPEQLPVLQGTPRFVLGGGSNLVLRGDVDGLVLHMAIPGRRLVGEDADAWYVEAGGGEVWHDFVLWTLEQGWPGLENLALIPGTVGAAPIQNIGAYGLEAGQRIHSVTAYHFTQARWQHYSATECRFGYRTSLFKQEGWHLDGQLAITSVTFRLPKRWQAECTYADIQKALGVSPSDQPTPRQIADAVIAVRQGKLPDPQILPNAGSFFQNPVIPAAQAHALQQSFPAIPLYPVDDQHCKVAAGWLIEQVGWKGRQLGPVGMYARQALVLVNHGDARFADLDKVVRSVQNDVFTRFAIPLVVEPVLL